MKLQRININSHVNEKITKNESEVNLGKLPILLHRAITDFENKLRETDAYADGYEVISTLLNIHPQTLRKYTNKFNPTYPTVNNLISICKITGDSKPIDYIKDYWELIK